VDEQHQPPTEPPSRERRQRGRYEFLNAWVKWEKWSIWRKLRPPKAEAQPIEAGDPLVDISAGGLAFTTADAPQEGEEVLVTVVLPTEGEPIVARGTVVAVQGSGEAEVKRAMVSFRQSLPEAVAATFRLFGDRAAVEEVEPDEGGEGQAGT